MRPKNGRFCASEQFVQAWNLGYLKQLKRRLVSTTDDSKTLTVVIKNFVLYAAGVLDPHYRLEISSSQCLH